jgi:hypothetical protein
MIGSRDTFRGELSTKTNREKNGCRFSCGILLTFFSVLCPSGFRHGSRASSSPQARPASPSPPGATGRRPTAPRTARTRHLSGCPSPQGRIAHAPGADSRNGLRPPDRAGGSLHFARRPSDAARRSSRGPRWPAACAAFAIGNASLADCGRRLVLRKRSALPRPTPFRHAGLNSILAVGLRPKTRSGIRPFRAVRLPLRGA